MEALTELCDLIVQHPLLLSEKLSWLCSRCPSNPTRLTRSHLNSLLATARFVSRCPNQYPCKTSAAPSPRSAILDFLRSLAASSFRFSFWPPSSSLSFISSFFSDLFRYITAAADLSPDFASAAGSLVAEVVVTAVACHDDDSDGVVKAFLGAVSKNCPTIPASDADQLVGCILDQLVASGEEVSLSSGETSTPWQVQTKADCSPVSEEYSKASSRSCLVGVLSVKGKGACKVSSTEDDAGRCSAGTLSGAASGSASGMSSLFQSYKPFGRVGDGAVAMRRMVAVFEEESIEALEKQEIAFRLLAQVLDKAPVKAAHSEQVRILSAKQLKSLPAFLKIRKADWTECSTSLKARIHVKLSSCQAAAFLLVASLSSLDLDQETSKMLCSTLTLLLNAAEACVLSSWQNLGICQALFSSLLSRIEHVVRARAGQLSQVLLLRLKPIVLTASAQGAMFESVTRTICEIIKLGWSINRVPLVNFVMGLAANIGERHDYGTQDAEQKHGIPVMQLNITRLLADLSIYVGKWEVVDMILPRFIECLEEGVASFPGLLRLRLLNTVSRLASLGSERSYRETVVLMTRSYLDKLSIVSSAESRTMAPESTIEFTETLPAGFLLVASDLTNTKLRSDYRHRLLSLCSDTGLAAESKPGRYGADFLGPLLPAVAEICTDFDPISDVEPSLLKLFRNLWFYVVLFGLAPPIQKIHKNQVEPKLLSSRLNFMGSLSAMPLQATVGCFRSNSQLSTAVQRISQGTPPLVVSSMKCLEDELELNAFHGPSRSQGSRNEKVSMAQRAALSAALGVQVEPVPMRNISGVMATYLLAVSSLEITRFSYNGGILNGDHASTSSRSAFSCVFKYLMTPNLLPAVYLCLTAVVHKAFETAVAWLEEGTYETGNEAELQESVLTAHVCFLIKNIYQREERVRDLSFSLLNQLIDRFSQVLWNSSCFDALLSPVNNDPPSTLPKDPSWIATMHSLYQKIVRKCVTDALSYAPCSTLGLLHENFCKLNMRKNVQNRTDVVSALSDIRLCAGSKDRSTDIQTINIPAVVSAAVAGTNLRVSEDVILEFVSSVMITAADKSNYIAEVRNLYDTIGGLQSGTSPFDLGMGHVLQALYAAPKQPILDSNSFNQILLTMFLHLLQQFVNLSEKGGAVDKSKFLETCSKATALILSTLGSDPKSNMEGFSQLLHLLCWCPAYILTPEAMETGVFIWTWIISAAPQLGSIVLAELVDAWLWTIDAKRGLFAYEMRYSGPDLKLRPQLTPGDPEAAPKEDPVEGILAHRLWLGFFIDHFEVVQRDSVEKFLLLHRMLQGTMKSPYHFSCHPAAVGTFFTVMLLGLKFLSCRAPRNLQNSRIGLHLMEDRVYRASFGWFAHKPEWYENNDSSFAHTEAQSISMFVQLLNGKVDSHQVDPYVKEQAQKDGRYLSNWMNHCHPIWGQGENYVVEQKRRKQLLLILCQHEADRLDVWAQPVNSKEVTSFRPQITSKKWIEYARAAFSVDPRIAVSLSSRFPTISCLRVEVTQLVQMHLLKLRTMPEALPFFVTAETVDENSVLLQQLPHWAACSITQALEFLTPPYKGHPRVLAYVVRVLESYPPEKVTFFMPQLVQALRYDEGNLVEGYLIREAQRSNIFAHILLWHFQGETCCTEPEKDVGAIKKSSFQALLPIIKQRIIDNFTSEARDLFQREFEFFDKVTSISGVLFPLPKEARHAGIRRELEKIVIEGNDLYLPTSTNKLVRGIQLDSGIPLQSAAKVPIMITFDVVDRNGRHDDVKPQACIFKVGDDCRQDALALQVISLLRDIFQAVGLNLYLFPYGVLPTGPERGIIEVVPNSRSRSQMGETADAGLYEIFQQEYGPVGSPGFEVARDNFIVSSAGYAVASFLLQPKDRHNGNLLFDIVGSLVHIDFGYILGKSPGLNMRFESADFKLNHEMTQLTDPSGGMKSDTWIKFVSLCVKGYLAARLHMDGIISAVLLMVDSGLPCFEGSRGLLGFSRGDAIKNLRKRFHPEMSEREAAKFMVRTCIDAYNKWSTDWYDLIQHLQQGIER